MKRMINMRILFFSAVAMGLGLLTGAAAMRYGYFTLAIGVGIAIPLLAFVTVFSLSKLRKRMNARCKAVSLVLSKIRGSLWAAILFFFFGVVGFQCGSAAFTRDAVAGVEGSVTGRVTRIQVSEGGAELWLENVSLIALGVETSLPGITAVTLRGDVTSLTGCTVGCFVAADGSLYSKPIIHNGGVDGYSYKNDLRYAMLADSGSIQFLPGKLHFFERLREGLRLLLFRNMAPELYGTAYGMLTGDTSYMGGEILTNFRTAGLAHVFAVSGLHVGFVAAATGFLLRKRKVNPFIRLAITAAVLGFYALFCGLGSSVLRASVMFLLLYTAKALGTRYDGLSALSAAFLLTLSVQPLMLFEVGFQMSYSVMFCLFTLSKPLGKLLHHKGAGMSVAAEIGILPLSVAYFHNFSLLGILVNIVFIPLVSVVFLALITASILTAIAPFLGILIKLPEIVIFATVFCTGAVAAIPYAQIVLYTFGGFVAFYYAAVFVSSRYLLIAKKLKTILSGALCACFVIGIIIWEFVPITQGTSVTVFGREHEQNAVFEFSDNARLFVNSSADYNCGRNVAEFFYQRRIRTLKGVVLCSLNSDFLGTVELLSEVVTFDTVYLPYLADSFSQTAYEILERNGLRLVFLENETVYADGLFTAHMENGEVFALETQHVLYCTELSAGRVERLKIAARNRYRVVRSDSYVEELNRYYLPDVFLSHKNVNYVTGENYFSAERYGAVKVRASRLKGGWTAL